MVPMTDPDITVLIINTNVKHELTGGEYAERRAQCEHAAKVLGVPSLREASMTVLEGKKSQLDDIHFRRARHVIGEIDRTVRAAEAIPAGDWNTVGQLMYGSHDSLRDDYEVSCPELDVLVEAARSIGAGGGVIGSRITGGGFGGSTVSLVHTDKAADIAKEICRRYQEQTGITATAFATPPARGAHVIV